MLRKNLEVLNESWTNSHDLHAMFRVWQKAFPCPKCRKQTLDFSAPRLSAPIICTSCLTLFNFNEKPRLTEVAEQ